MVFHGFWDDDVCSRLGSVNMDDDECADAASTLESMKCAKIRPRVRPQVHSGR